MMQFIVHILKRFSLALAFYLPLAFSLAFPCSAQTYFNKRIDYQYPYYEESARSILPIDSGYITVGFSLNQQNTEIPIIALQMMTTDGIAMKTVLIGDTAKLYFSARSSLFRTIDGNYAFAGGTKQFGDTIKDCALIIKLDGNLDTLWMKSYGNKDNVNDTAMAGRGLCQTSSGNYLLTGEQYSGGDYNELYLQKTDAEGNQL